MDELAPRVVTLLRAVRAGIDRYYSDKPFTMKVIAKYTKEKDPDIIDRTYEFYRKAGFKRELMISEPGIQGILDFLSETMPETKQDGPKGAVRFRGTRGTASCASLTAENNRRDITAAFSP